MFSRLGRAGRSRSLEACHFLCVCILLCIQGHVMYVRVYESAYLDTHMEAKVIIKVLSLGADHCIFFI